MQQSRMKLADHFEPDSTVEPGLRVDAVDDAQASAWNAFVADASDAAAYHDYRWRNIIRGVFAHETHYLAVRERGAVAGVLPLVRLKSRLFGDFLVSLPYFNYGGVLARTPAARDALLQHAAQLGRSLGVSHVELRHCASHGLSWPARADKVSMLLQLPDTAEALLKSLPAKLRSQVKRPVREGAEPVFGGRELLDEFYAVFAENMRDLGTPVYSKRFFAAILAAFPAQATLAVVRLRGAPVAGGFLLQHRGTMEIPWASSLRRVNNVSVNMYLYWRVLEFAVERGMRLFDFGRSTRDSGPYRFKKQWGAEPLQLHWHYWLANGGEVPHINPANPRYRLAVAAWQKLPLALANWLGPHVVRNLP